MKNNKIIIQTDEAPAAIGPYSQAVRVGGLVFISGQIPLDPKTGEVISGDSEAHIRQVFDNLSAVCKAAGGSVDELIKITVYLTDLSLFGQVNTVMGEYFTKPYPARAAVGVAELPKGVSVEVEGILSLAD